jgi:hypothetical protein
MMEAITGLVLLVNFGLGAVVGVRLLRMPAEEGWITPERALGIFFVVSHVTGGIVVAVCYGIWSEMGLPESPPWLSHIHAVGQLCMGVGFAMIFLFTQRTFYPASATAKLFVKVMCMAIAASLLVRAFHEGFAISVSPGPMHWVFYFLRLSALLWASAASIVYWIRMRKRARLGLADPMVANRFLLWGLWAIGSSLTALAEPIARLVYAAVAGESATAADSIQGTAGSLIQTTLAITSVLCLFTTSVLWLAFFPTRRYREWITARAESART